MRMLLRSIVLAACTVGSGCQFVCHIGKNLIHEPVLACDSKALHHRCKKLGKQAWNEMVKQYGKEFSCDYRSGFVDGFADHLYYGGCQGSGGCCAGEGGQCADGSCGGGSTKEAGAAGSGENAEYAVCPAVPPESYRRKKYMTPEGMAAIEDWYAGFRHGAATAMASGLRNLVVLPVQCPPKFGLDDGFQTIKSQRPSSTKKGADTAPPMPPADEVTPPATDTLPTPRPNVEANPMPTTPPPPGR